MVAFFLCSAKQIFNFSYILIKSIKGDGFNEIGFN